MSSVQPQSCDTFVVLPPLTKEGAVIFGKNSDRPQGECQELVYYPGREVEESPVMCTYITIHGKVGPVNSVILSKPEWIWGAEMGANDKNVVIGNEAVWTNNDEGDADPALLRLLGMDLVRLGLERGNTAEHAVDVITSLLEAHGQGGACSETLDLFYHNSFLIADPKEAWVLETSGKIWVAERVETGYRNISNLLSIGAKFDKHSANLYDEAKRLGLWDGQVEFNFRNCFSRGGDEERQQAGTALLKALTASAAYDVTDMLEVLRHKESRICRGTDDAFPTQGSQVSKLSRFGISTHWFTATPDATISYFKPFVFTPKCRISDYTKCPPQEEVKTHVLYDLHEEVCVRNQNQIVLQMQRSMEMDNMNQLSALISEIEIGEGSIDEVEDVMIKAVESEVGLYS